MPVIDVYKKYKRECLDRSDGHKHCQACNKCPRFTKGKIYTIKDDDGTEFDLCYPCKEKKWEEVRKGREKRFVKEQEKYIIKAIHFRQLSDNQLIDELIQCFGLGRNGARQLVEQGRKWYAENREDLIKFLEGRTK